MKNADWRNTSFHVEDSVPQLHSNNEDDLDLVLMV